MVLFSHCIFPGGDDSHIVRLNDISCGVGVRNHRFGVFSGVFIGYWVVGYVLNDRHIVTGKIAQVAIQTIDGKEPPSVFQWVGEDLDQIRPIAHFKEGEEVVIGTNRNTN